MQGNKFFAVIEPGLNISLFQGMTQEFLCHYHDYYLIGCLLGGMRQVVLGQKNFLLLCGDNLLLNPFQIHACSSVQSSPFCLITLSLSSEYMRKFAQSVNAKIITPYFIQPQSNYETRPTIYRCFVDLKNIILNNLKGDESNKKNNHGSVREFSFKSLQENIFYANNSNVNLIKEQIKTILSLVLHSAPVVEYSPFYNITHTPSGRLAAKFEKLPQNFSSLAPICKIFGMDKFALIRTFKNETSISPWRFMEAIKINQSVKLLESSKKISAISNLYGFADQSHFTRAFKSRMGLTPGQYRKFTQYKELILWA